MTKKQRRLYQQQYRAKQKGTVVDDNSKKSFKTLNNVIQQWNIAQRIKRQELGLLPNMWSNQNLGLYRNRYYTLQSNETGIDTISREQILRLSRELFFQLPGIGVASELKAEYVTGDHWDFIYRGKNKQWGEEAEKFINETWFQNCSTKGFNYDFHTILKVLSRTIDMDGDVLMLLVRNKNNWPLLQFVGAHRIGGVTTSIGGTYTNNIMGKPQVIEFGGEEYRCFDGVVVNDDFTPIGYCIRQDDAQLQTIRPNDITVDKKPVIVPIQSAQLIYSPLVFDKGRGLPSLYSSVLYGLQCSDLDNFLMDIAKLESTIAYIVQNDAGQAPMEYQKLLQSLQQANNSQLATTTTLEEIEPTVHALNVVKTPNVNYIKSDGGDIKSFHSDRPTEQIQLYMRNLETKLLSCIGIPHQIVYSPETISGRGVNAVTQLVRKSVSERQKLLKRHAKLAVAYALSVAMENGYISKNYDEDLNSIIDFYLPPEFTLDSNSDNKINLELFKTGLLSGEDYCKINDMNYSDICIKRKDETKRLLMDVVNIKTELKKETKKQHPNENIPEFDEAVILNLLTQRGTSTVTLDANDQQTNNKTNENDE